MKTRSRIIWIAVVLVLFAGAILATWFLKPPVVVTQQQEIDSLRNKHARDSMEYVWTLSKFDSTYTRLELTLKAKDRQIHFLRASLQKESERLIELNATESVAQFSKNTGDSSWVAVISRDTVCITRMPAITEANILIMERGVFKHEAQLYHAKADAYFSLLDAKNEELGFIRDRVIKLNEEYWKSQAIIDKQNKFLSRYAKKVRNRNIVIGVVSGLAAGAVITAIAK